MDRLLLFDIDGTLINTRGAGMLAFIAGINHVFEKEIKVEPHHFAGSVDLVVFSKLFTEHAKEGLDFEDTWQLFKKVYIEFLKLQALESSNWELFSGVNSLLKKEKENGSFISLLTGNMKQGAEIKLNAFNLWSNFASGGFGDVGEDRNHLAQIALEKCEKANGKKFKEVWVIGDTIADIVCGKNIGAKTLGVRTGFAKSGELENSGADLIVDNLINFEF